MRKKVNHIFNKLEAIASSKRVYIICTLIATVAVMIAIIRVQNIGYSTDYIGVYLVLTAMSFGASAAMMDLILAIISGIAQRMQELI